MEKIILQKYIANSSFCSRRKAEELILAGKVFVNGRMAEPGMRVGGEDDVVVGKNKIENNAEKIYIKLNKPAGFVCTNRKFVKEKNIFELIKEKEKLFVVGRLDKDSRGLVILTNDGDYAQKITHPSFGHEKEYLIKVDQANFDYKFIVKKIKLGVKSGDDLLTVKNIDFLGSNNFKIILTSGKKRHIRRIFEVLGLKVVDLLRTRIDDIKLNDLIEGNYTHFRL